MAKRRANGEGSIYAHKKDKNGKPISWAAQFTDNQGKRRTVYGKTQQEARQKMKDSIRQSDDGLMFDASSITVSEWLLKWLDLYHKPTVRASTYSQSYKYVHEHLIPAFNRVLLKDLRPDMIQKFMNDKMTSGRRDGKEGGLAVGTIRVIRSKLVTALDKAVESGLVQTNAARKANPPKGRAKEVRIMTRDEQRKLEETISKSTNPLSFAVLLDLYTGLRIGEIIGLKIEDIDLDKKELNVRNNAHYYYDPVEKKSKVSISEPKTAKGKRTIPLPDFMVDLLKDYIENRNKKVLETDGKWPGLSEEEAREWKDHGFLLNTYYGTQPVYATVQEIFVRLLKDAGIEKMKFHALRHTFATRCIEQGVDVKALSEFLGHSNANITLNLYSHTLEEQKRLSMDKLSSFYMENQNCSIKCSKTKGKG